MNYFITAIGTGSGKTVVSAIFSQALQADYWKPIQAGFPTDTSIVKNLISNANTTYHQEAYLLEAPISPHAAAKIENIEIELESITFPFTETGLIIEGAGGVMVPVNEKQLVIHLASQFDCQVVLVCNLYLGSINHSLLSIAHLKTQGYNLIGIVFNGKSNQESERIILQYAATPCLLRVHQESKMDKVCIKRYAEVLKHNLLNERIIK